MIISRQLAQAAPYRKEQKLAAPPQEEMEKKELIKNRRIGLALSGGGFRAAIFHLGVIRRLEELGIMPQVRVVSAVSGGSIIAAYYLCEMERRLHLESLQDRSKKEVRIRIFESIADDFFAALDHNLRSRALFYTPFYHPWLFIKSLLLKPFRATARSVLIQKEYDLWFYDENALDQLPSATEFEKPNEQATYTGTKLLLNTTSLLSGERVTFTREPISGVNEMSKVNNNVLLLSRVVGASSGVPGLFPPTTIAGDVLVDGGVADNQGIESLIHDPVQCNVLIVSDASGQMEACDTIKSSVLSVLIRVNSVLQFQVRNKLIDILVAWKNLSDIDDEPNRFAFIHLFRNLKDWSDTEQRMPSEFITGIGRIRTDLDQFSYIEREALMYHGYTLIDAQLRKYCNDVLEDVLKANPPQEMFTPPLFAEPVLNHRESDMDEPTGRDEIRADLEAGCQNVYLLRCIKKHPKAVFPIVSAGVAAAAVLLVLLLFIYPGPMLWAGNLLNDAIYGLIPAMAVRPIDAVLTHFGLLDLTTSIKGLSGLAAFILTTILVLYVISFPVYVIVRKVVQNLDRNTYEKLTGARPTVHWERAQPRDSLQIQAVNQ